MGLFSSGMGPAWSKEYNIEYIWDIVCDKLQTVFAFSDIY